MSAVMNILVPSKHVISCLIKEALVKETFFNTVISFLGSLLSCNHKL
jgi:hypothetical protein